MTIQKVRFLKNDVPRTLIIANIIMALVYFVGLVLWFPRGNSVLFWLLIVGEIYHVWMVLTFCHTIWKTRSVHFFDHNFKPPVDVFITVAGEPVEIVAKTVRAAKKMDYPDFKIYVLNDGYVAKKENWEETEQLAQKLDVNCITRKNPGGAKAGNINNGLLKSSAPFIVTFDADHAPHPDFLEKTVGYMSAEDVAFVQAPQYYRNHDTNYVTNVSWEQQELFFGAICNGKNRLNSVFMCGTNMLMRRKALIEVNGIQESITEDFLTGFLLHEKGWKSVYVPEILAEGLAPEDLLSYYKQQYRWARGSLEIVFKYNPLFRKGMSWVQKIQYLSSASFFLSGAVVILNALFPLIFFFTGIVPVTASTMWLALIFLPYIFLTVTILRAASNDSLTFRAVAFAMSAFVIHLKAMWGAMFGMKTKFEITSKQQLEGNFINLVMPHIVYILMVVVGVGVAILREGFSASVVTNMCWAIFNSAAFLPFIYSALPAKVSIFGTKAKIYAENITK